MGMYVSPSAGQRIDGDPLTGVINGVNTVFTTLEKFVQDPPHDSIRVKLNGQRLTIIDDYLVSESVPGNGYDTVTFVIPPRVGDHLLADYVAD